MKGTRVFRIKECELDLIKYKNNVQLNKCRKNLKGASAKCKAYIAKIDREYKVEAANAKDRFDQVTTEVNEERGKASKCKTALTDLEFDCSV